MLVLVAASIVGIGLFALTGWPLMLVLAPVAAVGVPALLAAPTNRDIELLQALDRWVRSLAATLPTGRSVPEAVRVSVRQAPDLLREPISELATLYNTAFSLHPLSEWDTLALLAASVFLGWLGASLSLRQYLKH